MSYAYVFFVAAVVSKNLALKFFQLNDGFDHICYIKTS